MLTLTEAGDLVSNVFRKLLGNHGLRTIILSESADHEGNPILRAYLSFEPGAPKLEGRKLIDAILEAETVLRERGENREVFVQPSYQDGEAADDDIADGKRKKQTGRR